MADEPGTCAPRLPVPCWTLAKINDLKSSGNLYASLPNCMSDPFGQFVPFFRTKDRAKLFAEEWVGSDLGPVELKTESTLRKLVEYALAEKVLHASVDYTPFSRGGGFCSLRDILDSLG